MCEKGGKRCEQSDALTLYKRKIARSKEYREAPVYRQGEVMSAAVDKWKNGNKKLVQEHAPKRTYFNTRAKPKDVAAVSNVLSERGVFDPVDESKYSVDELIEENKAVRAQLDKEYRAVKGYSILGYLRINAYLRKQLDNEEHPESSEVKRTEGRIADMEACLQKSLEMNPDKEHSVFRHVDVPAGWTGKQYAQKYLKTGEVVSDPGFISTTHSPSHVLYRANRAHAKGRASIVFNVHTRGGVSLQEKEPDYSTIQSQEIERLLPRDHRMVVVGTTTQTYVNDDNVTIDSSLAYRPKKRERSVTTVHCVSEELFREWTKEG